MNFDFGSFLGAVLGGLITLWGVRWTITYYKKSDQKNLDLQIFSERPDLKIVDKSNDKRPDLDLILVPINGVKSFDDNWVYLDYDKEFTKDKSDFEFQDYYFENAGKTAISYLNFLSANQKLYSIFDLHKDSIKKQIEDGDPHFNVSLDKRVDPGDVVKVRMYHSSKIYGLPITAPIVIALLDTSERLYSQAFFYPLDKIYSSRHYEGGYQKYLRDIRIDTYLDYMIDKLKRVKNVER